MQTQISQFSIAPDLHLQWFRFPNTWGNLQVNASKPYQLIIVLIFGTVPVNVSSERYETNLNTNGNITSLLYREF